MKSTVEKGDAYEDFVKDVYEKLLIADQFVSGLVTINIEKKKVLTGRSGSTGEFDLYWEYELAGVTYKTAIECKDYASTISVGKVRDFAYKLNDCGGMKGIFATKVGYQSGAQTLAESEGIELLIVREMQDEDWDGRIKEINVNIHFCEPPHITNIYPVFDQEWINEKFDLKPGEAKEIRIRERNDRIIVDDRATGKKTSLADFEAKVLGGDPGQHEWTGKYEDAYLAFGGEEYKIKALRLQYVVHEPLITGFNLNFEDQIRGVVKNIQKQSQTLVLKDGSVR